MLDNNGLEGSRILDPDDSELADLLLQASSQGLTIREEPIRFIYRVAGRSKLPFSRTAIEYLRLLFRTAVARGPAATAGAGLAGAEGPSSPVLESARKRRDLAA